MLELLEVAQGPLARREGSRILHPARSRRAHKPFFPPSLSCLAVVVVVVVLLLLVVVLLLVVPAVGAAVVVAVAAAAATAAVAGIPARGTVAPVAL